MGNPPSRAPYLQGVKVAALRAVTTRQIPTGGRSRASPDGPPDAG